MNVSFEWNQNGGASTNAEKVQLAGSFTQWQPVEMAKTDEKWCLQLDLAPGEYEFKFVVDGKWIHDEGQASKINEMGSHNNIVIVKTSRPTSVMSTSSSIEAIEDDDEGWEIIEKPKLNQSKLDNSKTPTIEVERKFIVPTNYHERLIANGFKLQMEFDEILVDKYYDTPEHALLNDDHWLRQRNGDWELKYPVGSGHSGGSTLYHETTCHEDILSKLTPILALEDFSLQQVLDSGKLDTFAHLETKRKCYSKDDVNIVIDATDWGHSIGEIEVMVTDHSQVGEASKRIELLGLQLEFETVVEGKMSSYLKKYNTKAYEILCKFYTKRRK